jgi:hypothetical protein
MTLRILLGAVIAAITLVCRIACLGQQKKPEIKIPLNALEKLRPEHPRLLASPDDFRQLKTRIAGDAKLQAWEASLQKEAEALLTATPSKYEIPDGLRLLETSRRVVNRVYALALQYRLSGEDKYARRAWQELEAAAQFKDWNPRHFLDTAEMTHAFAIGYDWLYDAWTEEERKVIVQAIVEKGFEPALPIYRGHRGWAVARHNWNQVCNGGMGMGALAIGEARPELAREILQGALQGIQIAMAEFGPDGAWKEGPGYWNYATSYNVVFLAGLDTALGTDFGLSEIRGFDRTGFFPIYLAGPLGRTFNYADGGDRAIHAAQLFWLGRRFQQPVFSWFEAQTPNPGPLDLLWYQPGVSGPKSGGLPLDKYFHGAEVVTLRSEWENSKAIFVGFKAGDNKANHSHLDIGSFVMDAGGARWAVDLGGDNYNLPGYFGNQRWNYYRLRAEGQNTLVIDPSTGPDQDPKAATRITKFSTKPERAFALADLTAAYAPHAKKVWRGIAIVDRKQVLVQDEVVTSGAAEIWWSMHTPAAVQIEQQGRTAVLKQVGAQLRAVILSPENAGFELSEAQPGERSPHPEGQAKNDGVKKLTIHLSKSTEARIAVLLIPATDEEMEATRLKIVSLNRW